MQANKELDALMNLDPSGQLTSSWADTMRAHVPPFTDDVIRTNMLATGVNPPAPDPNRETDARFGRREVPRPRGSGRPEPKRAGRLS